MNGKPHPNRTRRVVVENVAAEMGRRRITQKQLAAHLGVSQAAASDRLNGKTPFSLDEVDVLADWFGVPVGVLLTEVDYGAPPSFQRRLVTSGTAGSLTHEKLIVRHPPEWIRTRQEWNNGRAREHHTTTYGGFTCALISTASRQPRTAARHHSRLHLVARPTRTMGRR